MSAAPPLLQIRNLTKTYRSPDGEVTPILDIEAFDLGPGEQVALHGSSGSGKTTLLNIIAGILSPDSGTVMLDGVDLATASESVRDRHRGRTIGYVFQTFNLLQGYSAMENVWLAMQFGGLAPDRARAQALLTRVGLGDRLKHKPSQLSVGQQQRVAVARALANGPRLVLADEPTGNLDPDTAEHVFDILLRLVHGTGLAALIATHNLEFAARMDRRVTLKEGRLVEV